MVSTFDELPNAIKDAAKDQYAVNSIGGVHYYKGKTYLVRDKLADAQEVESTILLAPCSFIIVLVIHQGELLSTSEN